MFGLECSHGRGRHLDLGRRFFLDCSRSSLLLSECFFLALDGSLEFLHLIPSRSQSLFSSIQRQLGGSYEFVLFSYCLHHDGNSCLCLLNGGIAGLKCFFGSGQRRHLCFHRFLSGRDFLLHLRFSNSDSARLRQFLRCGIEFSLGFGHGFFESCQDFVQFLLSRRHGLLGFLRHALGLGQLHLPLLDNLCRLCSLFAYFRMLSR